MLGGNSSLVGGGWPLSNRVDNEPQQGKNVPCFPPPPTSEAETKPKSGRRPKPPPLALDAPETPQQTTAPRRKSSLRHSVGIASESRKQRLQNNHLPGIKLSPRHWMLVTIMVLSFVVLVLGFIYADCVALPHTDRADGTTTDDTEMDNISLYVRQADINPFPADPEAVSAPLYPSASDSDVDSEGGSSGGNAVLPSTTTPAPAAVSQANTTTPSEYLANESKRMGFDSPKNLAILFLYTATLPLLTVLHTIVEIFILHCAKRYAAPNTDSETLKPAAPSVPARLRYLPALSTAVSLLLTAGWIASNGIQLHCEIHLSSQYTSLDPSVNAATLPGANLCPIQTRGHFMRGIFELSVARNVLSWLLVLVYLCYVAWCVRVSGLVWQAAREEKKERQRLNEIEGKRWEQLKGTSGNVVRFDAFGNGSEEKKNAQIVVRQI